MRAPVIVTALALVACTPIEPPATPSGRPEVTLQDVDIACVRRELLNGVVNSGSTIRQANDNQIVFGQRVTDPMVVAFFGTGMGPPEMRGTWTVIPQGPNAVRLIADAHLVSNPGTAFERVEPMQLSARDQATLMSGSAQWAYTCRAAAPRPTPTAPARRQTPPRPSGTPQNRAT